MSESRPTFLQMCFSVLAAMFGVQTEKARARDFSHSNPLPYIAIGIIFLALFVLSILLLVRLVLSLAG
ncbi:MAG: DUF2970 domain-containing protein [Idiomarina sp.]|nr:DUF2970 domain-containing protein [Idiomarina sp.]